MLYGEIRRQLDPTFHKLARQKERQIIEGHLMPDHVHICIALPPKHAVSAVMGFLKGQSAIAIARQFQSRGATSRENTSGHAVMPCPRLGSKKSRCASTSAIRKVRMAAGASKESLLRHAPLSNNSNIGKGDRL